MRERILIVGASWLGDMVMSQSLLQLLKERNADIEIDVLAPNWSRPIIARMAEVSESIEMPVGHGQLQLKVRRQLAKQLATKNYQRAFVLPNSFKSALIPWWSKISQRTGWRGEMRYGLLNDLRHLDRQQYPLMFQHYLALGLDKGETLSMAETEKYWPRLTVKPEDVQQALAKHQLNADQPILALCPGAEFGPAKRWPTQHYATVAKQKLDEGWQVWILGSAKDLELANDIQTAVQDQAINLCGKTSIEDVVDLLSITDCVVSNDSGLMHTAAALDRQTIVLYGSTNPDFAPPLTKNGHSLSLNLVCSPCAKRECPLGHHQCMNDLKPQQVFDAMQS